MLMVQIICGASFIRAFHVDGFLERIIIDSLNLISSISSVSRLVILFFGGAMVTPLLFNLRSVCVSTSFFDMPMLGKDG
ncbi:hypothetical protein Scep_026747 [Stephania cephalantha]|uniref:Uncharacterized protein n=1 Tax=Stephania cephalantha TaxID=152367 RepID=A0AAP0HNG5_9MAGN